MRKFPTISILFTVAFLHSCAVGVVERPSAVFQEFVTEEEQDFSDRVKYWESLDPPGAPYYHPYYNTGEDDNWYYR